jgi:hypothetical protein
MPQAGLSNLLLWSFPLFFNLYRCSFSEKEELYQNGASQIVAFFGRAFALYSAPVVTHLCRIFSGQFFSCSFHLLNISIRVNLNKPVPKRGAYLYCKNAALTKASFCNAFQCFCLLSPAFFLSHLTNDSLISIRNIKKAFG